MWFELESGNRARADLLLWVTELLPLCCEETLGKPCCRQRKIWVAPIGCRDRPEWWVAPIGCKQLTAAAEIKRMCGTDWGRRLMGTVSGTDWGGRLMGTVGGTDWGGRLMGTVGGTDWRRWER